jgi:hypothetical protein
MINSSFLLTLRVAVIALFLSISIALTSSLVQAQETAACSTNADLNGDDRIDVLDYTALISQFNRSNTTLSADLNCDGRVNLLDYTILVGNS